MLQQVALDVVRGRIAVAAGCAVVGVAAALGWPRWPPAPFLVGALLFSFATLLFAIAARRVAPFAVVLRVVLVALLLAHDAALLVATAFVAGEPAIAALLAAPLVATLLIHARAIARFIVPLPFAAVGACEAEDGADPEAAAARADLVHGRAREAIGIVRARAEALQLAAAEAGVGTLLGHDLGVLVRQAEECQRVLRELERAREPAPADAEANFPARGLDSAAKWPSASTPPPS